MPNGRMSALALVMVAATGCYHATIETGATPSTTVVRKAFASSWIYGLVPPSTVATASKCPDGVARVETQVSFLNLLVRFLTLGIYTPMQIVVTCASPGGSADADSGDASNVEYDANAPTGLQDALALAITRSAVEKRPIYIQSH